MAASREFMDFPSDRDMRDHGYTCCGPQHVTACATANESGAVLCQPPVCEAGDPRAGSAVEEDMQHRVAPSDEVERLVRDDCVDPVEIARVVTKASVRPRHILLAVQLCASHDLIDALGEALDPCMHSDPVLAKAWETVVARGDGTEMRAVRLVFY